MNRIVCKFYFIAVVCWLFCFFQGCSNDPDEATSGPKPIPAFSITDAQGNTLTEAVWHRGTFVIHKNHVPESHEAVIEATELFTELRPEVQFERLVILDKQSDHNQMPGWKRIEAEELYPILRQTFGDFTLLLIKDGIGEAWLPYDFARTGWICAGMHEKFVDPKITILDHLNSYPPHELLPIQKHLTPLFEQEISSQRLFFINNIRQKYKGKFLIHYLDGRQPERRVRDRVLFGPQIPDHEAQSLLANLDLPPDSSRADPDLLEAWEALDRKQYKIGVNFVIEFRPEGEIDTVFLSDTTMWQYIRSQD